MRAAFVRAHGPADSIEYGALPTPTVGANDVLVRMEATAVNQLFVRSGAYQSHIPFPFIVGHDLVGSVEAAGVGVGGFSVGGRGWCDGRDESSSSRSQRSAADQHPKELAAPTSSNGVVPRCDTR